MITYTVQPLSNGLLFMAIPIVASALLWFTVRRRAPYYRKKYTGSRLWLEMWGSPLLISLLAILPFYYFLFWEPFYAINVQPGERWTLIYYLPRREVVLDTAEIATVASEDVNLPWRIDNNRLRQRLLVTTKNEKQYRSMLQLQEETRMLLAQLEACLMTPAEGCVGNLPHPS